jgi:L-threonylcarbamoyladenylate synthase
VVEVVPASAALEPAVALLEAGELVALPTETVYGLAGDATNGAAVARIFEVKGRPRFNPLIVHVASVGMAEEIASFDPVSRRLAEALWPGPITLVLQLREGSGIHPLATAGRDTVAVRMPEGFAHELIGRFGKPLAAPSANRSGRVSPTTAKAVADDLGERIRLVVDGGRAQVGVESTIVKVEQGQVRILRPGGISAEEIETLVGAPVTRKQGKGAIEAPGMMASHYAPHAAVRLNAAAIRPGEALLAFGPRRARETGNAVEVRNLSERGDLREAAANLFSFLNELDRSGAAMIAVEPIPLTGLGEAINDRLMRAAAPRTGTDE